MPYHVSPDEFERIAADALESIPPELRAQMDADNLLITALAGSEGSTLHQARAAYERDYILKKLDENHGNVSRTAEVLGLERSHLYRKMKALAIAAKES